MLYEQLVACILPPLSADASWVPPGRVTHVHVSLASGDPLSVGIRRFPRGRFVGRARVSPCIETPLSVPKVPFSLPKGRFAKVPFASRHGAPEPGYH